MFFNKLKKKKEIVQLFLKTWTCYHQHNYCCYQWKFIRPSSYSCSSSFFVLSQFFNSKINRSQGIRNTSIIIKNGFYKNGNGGGRCNNYHQIISLLQLNLFTPSTTSRRYYATSPSIKPKPKRLSGGTAASRADEKWEQELWEDAAAAEEEELRKEKERTKREEREEQEEEQERNEEEQEQERRRKEEEERPSWRKRVLYWSPLPIFGLFTGNELKRVLGDKNPEHPFAHWEISVYRLLPWRTMSRTWGAVNRLNLPIWARVRFISWYATAFGCDLSEAEQGADLSSYRNLGEFFRRSLKPGMRPICPISPLVSPVDGTLLHAGIVSGGSGKVEQVKGVKYSLQAFLGPNTWGQPEANANAWVEPNTWGQSLQPEANSWGQGQLEQAQSIPNTWGQPSEAEGQDQSSQRQSRPIPWLVEDVEYEGGLLRDPDPVANSLYTSVLYLAPGDYHRFHSPVNWRIKQRRHFPGELLSVNPRMARWISGLFTLNERAAYVGDWEHGFFSMTAVGATNVGSIHVYSDPELSTNTWTKGGTHGTIWRDKDFLNSSDQGGITLKKGQLFGEFNLGSTIVLVFEAPKSWASSSESATMSTALEAMTSPPPIPTTFSTTKVKVGRPLLFHMAAAAASKQEQVEQQQEQETFN